MSSTQTVALKHWAKIIKQWPVDKVRPETVSFRRLMQQRIKRSIESVNVVSDGKKDAAKAVHPREWDEAYEMKQANALYALMENKYAQEWPLPKDLRYPASHPTHYDDIVREMEEAPTRSWFSAVIQRIRGSLRLR